MAPTYQLFINKQHVAPSDGQSIPVIYPSDGIEFAKIARGGSEDVDRAVTAARTAFGERSSVPWETELGAVRRGTRRCAGRRCLN
jgi:acyl-CoA reductase-like NAD-dependent aldehyde dehydrogenase